MWFGPKSSNILANFLALVYSLNPILERRSIVLLETFCCRLFSIIEQIKEVYLFSSFSSSSKGWEPLGLYGRIAVMGNGPLVSVLDFVKDAWNIEISNKEQTKIKCTFC